MLQVKRQSATTSNKKAKKSVVTEKKMWVPKHAKCDICHKGFGNKHLRVCNLYKIKIGPERYEMPAHCKECHDKHELEAYATLARIG